MKAALIRVSCATSDLHAEEVSASQHVACPRGLPWKHKFHWSKSLAHPICAISHLHWIGLQNLTDRGRILAACS